MKTTNLLPHHVQIPLRFKFSQSNNTTSTSDSIVLEITTDSGTKSYGECCPRTYVTGESVQSVFSDLEKVGKWMPAISFTSISDIQYFIQNELVEKVGPATRCAIELALLDAFSKEQEKPINELMGFEWPTEIQYSGIVPLYPLEKMDKVLAMLSFFQFNDLKIKVGRQLEDTLERIKLVKSVFPGSSIRLDANCSWEMQDALDQIPVLLEKNIRVFEQVFPIGKEADLAKITRQFGKQAELMVDESATTLESVKHLIDNGIGNRINLKISKHGGLFNSLAIIRLATGNGYSCQLGAHYGETCILTSAGIILSAMAGNLKNHEGAYGRYLLTTDITEIDLAFGEKGIMKNTGGKMSGFGLGPTVDLGLLEADVRG